MPNPRDVLTPEALSLLHTIAKEGSFAAAARTLGQVPSALTYRVRQMEDSLDVLLFDRRSRRAQLTPAGQELARAGEQVLNDLDALANRVKRVATGWETQFTVAVDGALALTPVLELCEAFYALNPPTRLKLREEVLSGTLATLTSGQADLAIGVVLSPSSQPGLRSERLGPMRFVYAVAPHHPLAALPAPLSDASLLAYRAVAVADSVQRGEGLTFGLLGGQEVFTVPTMAAKLQALLRGIGGGFVPEYLARPFVTAGHLVIKPVQRGHLGGPANQGSGSDPAYAWLERPTAARTGGTGKALQWWLAQLASAKTRTALLGGA
jgi:DNA-binding transcriptional LysR family regulator